MNTDERRGKEKNILSQRRKGAKIIINKLCVLASLRDNLSLNIHEANRQPIALLHARMVK